MDQHHRRRVREPADVVNVAVSIVTDWAGHQPQHIGYAKIFHERLLNLLPAQTGISHLHFRIEVAFLRGQERAAPIHLDSASLDYEILAVELGIEKALTQNPCCGFRHAPIFLPIFVLGPSVEMKMNDSRF